MGLQDTSYVGTPKGIAGSIRGRILTAIRRMHSALTAADMFADRVIPLYEEQDIPILCILMVSDA